MKTKRMNPTPIESLKRQSESGVALLTVLALLSIFAVVLVGFTYTIRMEEQTIQMYADSINVQEATEAAIQGVLAQVARDLDPAKPHILLGRRQPRYVSLLDPWAMGYGGRVGARTTYDARSHLLDIRPEKVLPRQGLTMLPTPIPRGVDEDPVGDVTGRKRIGMEGMGDNSPGLAGIDDDLDGEVDGGLNEKDDDEDYRVDEDGPDQRRPDKSGIYYFPPGTGYDSDGDRLGVFDESAKININFAGNNFGQNGGHTYNLGVNPAELDLPLFIYNRVVRYRNSSGVTSSFSANQAEDLAKYIVNFRNGSVGDGGNTLRYPGVDRQDDNNNNNPQIVTVQEYSDTSTDISSFEAEPYAIVGNSADDDLDGLRNEEDERYIGPPTENTASSPLTKPFDHDNPMKYRPGNKIDDDGDGTIDERDEGIDDPGEFNVLNPQGDDRPFATVDDLKLVRNMRYDKVATTGRTDTVLPTLFEIMRDSTTIYSQSDEMSGPLSGRLSETAKINPNGSSNWRANEVWNVGTLAANRADFQYSPPVRIEDLLPLQIDRDGDWQLTAEPDVLAGKPDGKDNDGDGLVDEPSDDYDNNLYPSGDFDTAGESDLGAPAYQTGPDYDGDGDSSKDKIRSQNILNGRLRELGWEDGAVTLDETDANITPGMMVEGNGTDNDGDGIIDDDGDFNGDKYLTYDPEAHVSEDAWGDANGDGYPGLGAPLDASDNTLEGRIIKRPDLNDDFLITSLADDDYDGFADFYDPQVLAAMYAPELDGVDNDSDGEVDELGERYIACYDDDEDGRMDEDPPDFQLALNLIDYIDTWMPFKAADDPDIKRLLGLSGDEDAVLADGVTFRTLNLYSSRQRSFRMHPRLLTGPNSGSKENRKFREQMRFLLPNPPKTGMPVKFEGVEAIRINEVMAKPVIRLEAEETLDTVSFDSQDPSTVPTITPQSFRVLSGQDDDGKQISSHNYYDSNWGNVAPAAQGSADPVVPSGFKLLPFGFTNTLNPFRAIVNLDSMAPAFIFGVTNVSQPLPNQSTTVGQTAEETAEWVFDNIPAGIYDVVLYLHPNHLYQPEVHYAFNGKEIGFRSDFSHSDPNNPLETERIRRDTARFEMGSLNTALALNYRLTPYPIPDLQKPNEVFQRVQITDGRLTVTIVAGAPLAGKSHYETSFDRIELINLAAQYVELVNLSTEDIDLSGWTVNTPYGHYILPKDSIIGRMKPSFKNDDDTQRIDEGMEGNGVPFEPLLTKKNMESGGSPIAGTDFDLEDNKLLLAYDTPMLKQFISDNYPPIPKINNRIVQPVMAEYESDNIQASLPSVRNVQPGPLPNAQIGDFHFRLVDVQDDILTYNPADKLVTLYDPAGNYIDSFKYRTTFNNVIVNILENGVDPPLDLIALPGYRGMETYERADPTHFETELVANPGNGDLSGTRSVPSSIKMDVKDAILVDIATNGTFSRNTIGGYVKGNESDRLDPKLTRFSDENSFPVNDAHWNGWDFIGDHYEYGLDTPKEVDQRLIMEDTDSMAREAVAVGGEKNVRFFEQLGGFENRKDVQDPNDVRYTAFIWRLGVRELIRAGYDPNIDDQLTVRVRGRKFIDENGLIGAMDMPVGEVLVIPPFKTTDPGKNFVNTNPGLSNNLANIYMDKQRGRVPVFAKLRNGDTAFTVDLRESFTELHSDLINESGDEPTIELMLIMRKSTPDLSAVNPSITPELRPDLAMIANLTFPWDPNAMGDYVIGGGLAGNMGDDNYFFKGIELFGRSRVHAADDDTSNQRRALLAGTPGWDNTGYVPAYPRRRLRLNGSQRDKLDVIDNTAYVKNGPLATLGEVSRLFTGNKFETVNTPIIPQRLEDRAVKKNQVMANAMLAMRAKGKQHEYRVQLAQRERLDQWENQYTQIYNMITTSDRGIRAALININTAPREVLVALPFTPPLPGGGIENLQNRHFFNTICADFIIEGRQPGGHDMYFGIHDMYDARAVDTAMGINAKRIDTMADYKLPSIGRDDPQTFKTFDDIETQRLQRLNIESKDVIGNTAKYPFLYLSSIVSPPDDGPYSDVGTMLSQLTHLKRRERYSKLLSRNWDRTFDRKKESIGDLRERLNLEDQRELTPEDMEALMNRVSSLMTVRSRAFSILTQGRVFDTDGNITAQRKLETIYMR